MNLTNHSESYDHEKNPSSDEEEEDEKDRRLDNPPSIRIENFFSETNDDGDDEEFDSTSDEDGSDIENRCYSKSPFPIHTRLGSLLRQSNHLVELKLNIFPNRLINNPHQSLRHALSDSDMSKRSYHYQNNQHEQESRPSVLLPSLSSNHFSLSTTRAHRLYLPSSYLYDLQTQITTWLQASTLLIDTISTTTYHRRCWSQLLLTYFIEQGYSQLEFLRCTHSVSLTTMDQESCSMHKHGCVPEEDAYKLCSILQKGSRLNIDSTIFDHIRRIIVIKSIQEGN